jgi:uncharacterized protein (TIGR02217 family)
MGFAEIRLLPDEQSYHFKGGPVYDTTIVETASGAEQRFQTAVYPLHAYTLSYDARLPDVVSQLDAFFRSVGGRRRGFRIKDPRDFMDNDNGGSGVLDLGVGTGFPTAQMQKKYVFGTESAYRIINKPVQSVAPVILKAGVPLTEVTQWEVDLSKGIITWVALSTLTITAITQASPGVVTVSGSAPANGKLVYISNAGGMYQVNGQVFTVAGSSGSSFQLSGIDTRGYQTFTSGGTAQLFYQPTDVLTWMGPFDVAVRFDTDTFDAEIIDRSGSDYIVGWSDVPLVEIRTVDD